MVRLPEKKVTRRRAATITPITTTKEEFTQFLDRFRFDLNDFPEWERPYLIRCMRGDDLSNWPPRESRMADRS